MVWPEHLDRPDVTTAHGANVGAASVDAQRSDGGLDAGSGAETAARVGGRSRPVVAWTARHRVPIVLVAALGALAALVTIDRSPDPKPFSAADAQRTAQTVVDAALKKAAAAPARSAEVYRTIAPSLVTIESDAAGDPTGSAADRSSSTSLGAGVIINADGAILTAFHVIDGAQRIRLTFADGTKANATVDTADPDNDIAVLSADNKPEVIVPAVLGGGAQIGDEVYAVGNPLGLIGSMSAGVVSGLNRSIPIDDTRSLDGLIQFDAAANPGNSGGPLLDRNGQVIGVVTALANPADQPFFTGIAFAVTIKTAGGAAGGPQQ